MKEDIIPLMKIKDLSKILNIASVTIRRQIKKGVISSYHRIGRQYFFTQKNLEEILSKTEINNDDN